MKAKYVTTQLASYSIGPVEITREGFITEDEDMIARLESRRDFGKWFYRVPTDEELMEERIADAKKLLSNACASDIIVPRLTEVNIEEEEVFFAEETAIREKQAAEEEAIMQAKREENARIKELREARAKKPGRPPKS